MRDRAEKKSAKQAAQNNYSARNEMAQRECVEKRKGITEQEKDAVKRLTGIYDSEMRAML